MAKLNVVASQQHTGAKESKFFAKSGSNPSLGSRQSQTSTESDHSAEDSSKISWKMIGISDEDSFETTESEVATEAEKKEV
jgi:hypothetical protein